MNLRWNNCFQNIQNFQYFEFLTNTMLKNNDSHRKVMKLLKSLEKFSIRPTSQLWAVGCPMIIAGVNQHTWSGSGWNSVNEDIKNIKFYFTVVFYKRKTFVWGYVTSADKDRNVPPKIFFFPIDRQKLYLIYVFWYNPSIISDLETDLNTFSTMFDKYTDSAEINSWVLRNSIPNWFTQKLFIFFKFLPVFIQLK